LWWYEIPLATHPRNNTKRLLANQQKIMAIPNLQSFRETLKTSYTKPDSSLLDNFIQQLSENKVAMEYLKITRNLSDKTIEHFKLGYCSEKEAIVIPVFKGDELINIRYRHLNPESKQKYSQTHGCEVWVFNDDGFNKAKERGSLLIVEGEFDLMSAWQAGFKAIISPASGKDSYGVWLEHVDNIPKIYIAYDNDKPGKQASKKFAERVGVDKCFEVEYAPDVKDANEFFQKYTAQDFLENIKNARPFYKYQFSGIPDIVTELRETKSKSIILDTVPMIDWNDVWVAVLSGRSGAGKTSFGLNIASELASKKIPTLVLPFERGIKNVGKRFLQVRYNIRTDQFPYKTEDDWNDIIKDATGLPLYFAVPSIADFPATIEKAKRFFDIQYCIIDHLDYFVKGQDKFSAQSDVIRQIETMAQELEMRFIVVHHINKGESNGSFANKKPTMEMLTGSSDIYKVPEAVLLLYQHEDGLLEFIVDKNKGQLGSAFFTFNSATGKVTPTVPEKVKEQQAVDEAFKNF
jgi:twinkle protein